MSRRDPFSLDDVPAAALQGLGVREDPIAAAMPVALGARVVIVHGPRGSGKTRNAEALRELVGADRVVDDWDGRSALLDGDLALTHCELFHGRRGVRVVSIETAIALLEISRPLFLKLGDRNP